MFETKSSLLNQKTPRTAQGLTVGISNSQVLLVDLAEKHPLEDELSTSQGRARQVPLPSCTHQPGPSPSGGPPISGWAPGSLPPPFLLRL